MKTEDILLALVGGIMTSLPTESDHSPYKKLAGMGIITKEEKLLLDMALNTVMFTTLQEKGFSQGDSKDPNKSVEMDVVLKEAHEKYVVGIVSNYLVNKLGSIENANKLIVEHISGI